MTNQSPPKPKSVMIATNTPSPSATQKISFGQPFSSTENPSNVTISFACGKKEKTDIDTLLQTARPDLVVLSRYTDANGQYWIQRCRTAGIPVIFHIDDDLLAVPRSLGEKKYMAYNTPRRLEALRKNIEGSDLLYVSTKALADRFKEHAVNVPIISGDIYCSVTPDDVGSLLPPATGPVIGYMGTGGHSADLSMILPAVCRVMEHIPELQFEVFGTIDMPTELHRFGSRVRHLPPVADYADFIPHMRSLGWWVGLAPLEDNVFNRCKADTKWVEYSLAGMAVIASDLPVYHRACKGGTGVLAQHSSDWEQALLHLICRPDYRAAMVSAAQNKLRTGYSHAALRSQVLDIFAQVGLHI